MLRRRTSFKPNLQKVTQQQPQQQQQQQNINHAAPNNGSNASITPEQPKQPQLEQLDPSNTNEPSNIITEEQKQQQQQSEKEKTITLSNQKVQDAITQLTGQKFEPIKSLSLRSSVNKNVKLKDLLFFNPPMTKDQKRHKKSVILAKKNEKKKAQEDSQSATKSDNEDNNNEANFGPKVKLGPEGKLILDESSTIINRKNAIKEKEAIIEDNEDIISRTNYDSFRRRPTNVSQTKWSNEDTQKFYHALTILGTDFSMMESLLFAGTRSRTELHKKFKREERVNKLKVDIALSNRISLNSEELEDLKEVFYDRST